MSFNPDSFVGLYQPYGSSPQFQTEDTWEWEAGFFECGGPFFQTCPGGEEVPDVTYGSHVAVPIDPAPDFIIIEFHTTLFVEGYANGCELDGTCGPTVEETLTQTITGTGGFMSDPLWTDPITERELHGYILPTGGGAYDGDPGNEASALLWNGATGSTTGWTHHITGDFHKVRTEGTIGGGPTIINYHAFKIDPDVPPDDPDAGTITVGAALSGVRRHT